MTLQKIQQKYSNQIPVPIVKIAKNLGIVVYEVDHLPDRQSGLIKKVNGKFVIFVNDKHAVTRQRFTVAHEIAHFIKNKDFLESEGEHQTVFRQPVGNNAALHRAMGLELSPEQRQREVEANKIAAQLLMPEEAFKQAWLQASSVKEVADKFLVSEAATTIRGKELFSETFI